MIAAEAVSSTYCNAALPIGLDAVAMAEPPSYSSSSYGAIPPGPERNQTQTVQIGDIAASSASTNSKSPLLPVVAESVRLRGNSKADDATSSTSTSTRRALLNGEGSHHIAQTASVPSTVVNVTKNLIGGGVLSLSGGIALFADTPSASISAVCWVIVLGAVLGYFCFLIGKICETTRSTTYREAWERSVGRRGGTAVAVVNALDPLLGIFANASIMAQSLHSVLEGVDVHWTVVESLLLITVVALLPLCLMKNLSALAPFSAIGVVAVLFALTVMVLRYLDGSYQPGGVFYDDLSPDMKPSFGSRNRPWSTEALPFVCMVYTSFDMHYNTPRYYAELRDASGPRFGKAVVCSFAAGSALLFSIAVAGFLTFGANSNSFILNNYSPRDPLATLSRLAIGLCSLAAYPLNFIGVRDHSLDIIGIADKVDTAAKLNAFTVVLLSILTVTNCFVTDLGLINSVGGGTTVTLVDFVFPALMFRALIRNKLDRGTFGERLEARIVMVLMLIGVVLGLIGAWNFIVVALAQ